MMPQTNGIGNGYTIEKDITTDYRGRVFLHVDDERRRRRDQVFIPPGKCFYYELGRVVRRNDDGRRDIDIDDAVDNGIGNGYTIEKDITTEGACVIYTSKMREEEQIKIKY